MFTPYVAETYVPLVSALSPLCLFPDGQSGGESISRASLKRFVVAFYLYLRITAQGPQDDNLEDKVKKNKDYNDLEDATHVDANHDFSFAFKLGRPSLQVYAGVFFPFCVRKAHP
jgi:hypothetical protein